MLVVDVFVDLYVASAYGKATRSTAWFEGRSLFVAMNGLGPVGFMVCTDEGELTLIKVGDQWLGLGVAGVLIEAARRHFAPTELTYGYPVSADGEALITRYGIPVSPRQDLTETYKWPPSEARAKGEAFWDRVNATDNTGLPAQPTRSKCHFGTVGDR